MEITPYRTGTFREPWSMDRDTGVGCPSLLLGVYTCFCTHWGWDRDIKKPVLTTSTNQSISSVPKDLEEM